MSDPRDQDDEVADSALRAGLRSARLPPQALQRIRQATQAQWRASLDEVPPARTAHHWKLAAAAGVLVLVGAAVVAMLAHQAPAGPTVATVLRSDAPGVQITRALRSSVPVRNGEALHVPARLESRGDALLALAGGGNLRVARGSQFELPAKHTLRLMRGELYLDIPPGSRGSEPFVVVTTAGEFRHLGTQFGVAIIGDQTRLRVREGSVRWQGAGDAQTVDAGTELIVDQRVIARRSLPTAGREWAWVESLAPDFEIEGRPLREFLIWFARETGRKLEMVDAGAERQASSTLMHGSVRGLSALEALAAVMSATTLHYELPAGAIRVSSGREPGPTS